MKPKRNRLPSKFDKVEVMRWMLLVAKDDGQIQTENALLFHLALKQGILRKCAVLINCQIPFQCSTVQYRTR